MMATQHRLKGGDPQIKVSKCLISSGTEKQLPSYPCEEGIRRILGGTTDGFVFVSSLVLTLYG